MISENQYNKIKNLLIERAIEKQYLEEDGLSGAATGAATGAAIGSFIPGVGTVVGGVVGAAAGYLLSSDGTMEGVRKIFKSCSVKGMGTPTMKNSELEKINGLIYQSIQGSGTNEDMLKINLAKFKTIPDLCRASYLYKNTYAETLFDAIDGDIDSDSQWKDYVYTPLLPAINLAKKQKSTYGAESVGGGLSYSQKNDYTLKSKDGKTLTIPAKTGYSFKPDKKGASFRLGNKFGWFGCTSKTFKVDGIIYSDNKGDLANSISKSLCGTIAKVVPDKIEGTSKGSGTSGSTSSSSDLIADFQNYI